MEGEDDSFNSDLYSARTGILWAARWKMVNSIHGHRIVRTRQKQNSEIHIQSLPTPN